jgi:lactoylglutathione lyase
MPIRIEHIGIWVRDLDQVAAFYAEHLAARVGELYRNPAKGFTSRFLSFAGGARLELMTRTGVTARFEGEGLGLAHLAIEVGDEAAVDRLAARLESAGALLSRPRRTGDGYYECVARDPEGNRVELMAGGVSRQQDP